MDALQPFELPALLILGDRPGPEALLQLVGRLPAVVADLHARLLGPLAHLLDHVAAPLLAHGRHVEADHDAIDVWHQADVALGDGSLDRRQNGAVPGLDHDEVRVRNADPGQLVERRRGSVVIDGQVLDQRGGGTTGADAGEVALHGFDRALHLRFRGENGLAGHGSPSPVMSVPSCSPRTARTMFPACVISKTTIGISLSMARLTAVASSAPRRLESSSV